MEKGNKLNFPTSVNIGGMIYSVNYVEKASDSDIEGRVALWGQIDYWTRSIRIYITNRTKEDIMHTLLHEILHAISQQFKLNLEDREIPGDEGDKDSAEESSFVDIFSLLLFDTLNRNNLFNFQRKN